MKKVMNESIITKEDLANAAEVKTWMDVSETIKEYFGLDNAVREGIIGQKMTLVEALTAMIIAETSKIQGEKTLKSQKGKTATKKATIHLLPELPHDFTGEEFHDRFMENWELAATIDFIPDSLETLKAIDYTELKMLMDQNDAFFNAAVELCADLIEDLIRVEKEVATEMFEDGEIDESDYKAIQSVMTFDDLMNSGRYGEDFEQSRGEFINVLVEDHLYRTHR